MIDEPRETLGLAQARFPKSVEDGVEQVKHFLQQAKEQGCDIVCFPEAYLPGMRVQGFEVPPHDPALYAE